MRRALLIVAGIATVATVATVAGIALWPSPPPSPPPSSLPATAAQQAKPGEEKERRLPSVPGGPERDVTPEGKPSRVVDRDAQGRPAYEKIDTPEGSVIVQRTYRNDGTLLEERATRDGQPVAVPRP